MKRIFTLLTFFISILSVCTLSVVEGYGQLTGDNYPVQAHVYVQRPSLKMPEYFSSSTMLRTDLILKDLTKTTLDVYLSWQITGLGLGVEAGTLPGFVPPGYLTLTKGSKRQLSGAELREYFQPGMLAVSGVGENVIFNGKLPEGFYTIKITAYEAGTGRQVSNTAETFFSVAYALPPVINLPLIGSEQPVTRPQSVLLQWMPRHTATGSNRITYSGKVCEVAEDEDPNVAINGSQNCFTIPAQPGTSYVLKASDLPLKVGKRYAFQVQVTDNNDQLEFQNQGYSEVSWFRFGEACKPPSGLQVNAIATGRLNVSWNANPQATGYKLLYRSTNQTEWTEQTTLGTSVSLVSLNPELDYEFKVITICEPGNESPESEIVTWEGEEEIDEELEILIKKVLNPEGEPIVSTGPGIQRAVPGIEKAIPYGPLPETFEDLIPKDPTKIPCQSQLHSYEECSDQHPEGHISTADKDLQTLKVGDLITIYDYLVVLTEVSGGNNIFSGKGLVKMPFLEDKKMPVEFSNVEIKRDNADQNGGCVTAVNGYFRVRTGLSPEQIRQEEIDLIHEVRTNTDPGSIYISRGQVITELGEELGTTGKDLCDGKPITEEAKQSLLKKHTLAKQGLQDWAEDAADLYDELDLDGTKILGRIQAMITALEANIAIINSGEGCPENPDIKTEMDAIKEKIKADIEKSKEPTDNLPEIKDVVVKNITESEATITWKGDKRFTKYLVSYQTEGQGEVFKIIDNPTIMLQGLQNFSNYKFKIVGVTDLNKSTHENNFTTLFSNNYLMNDDERCRICNEKPYQASSNICVKDNGDICRRNPQTGHWEYYEWHENLDEFKVTGRTYYDTWAWSLDVGNNNYYDSLYSNIPKDKFVSPINLESCIDVDVKNVTGENRNKPTRKTGPGWWAFITAYNDCIRSIDKKYQYRCSINLNEIIEDPSNLRHWASIGVSHFLCALGKSPKLISTLIKNVFYDRDDSGGNLPENPDIRTIISIVSFPPPPLSLEKLKCTQQPQWINEVTECKLEKVKEESESGTTSPMLISDGLKMQLIEGNLTDEGELYTKDENTGFEYWKLKGNRLVGRRNGTEWFYFNDYTENWCPFVENMNLDLEISNSLNNCADAESSGQIDVSVNRGVAPFIFSINDVENLSLYPDFNFANLKSGTYKIAVKDKTGCSATKQIEIGSNPTLKLTAKLSECDNKVTLNASCGSPPYLYSINGIDYSEDLIFDNIQEHPDLSNEHCQTLDKRSYADITFYAKDSAGDIASVILKIEDNKMVEIGENSILTGYMSFNPSCHGNKSQNNKYYYWSTAATIHHSDIYCSDKKGSILIDFLEKAQFMNPPYTVNITDENGFSNTKTGTESVEFSNLESGVYTISGYDKKGCKIENVDLKFPSYEPRNPYKIQDKGLVIEINQEKNFLVDVSVRQPTCQNANGKVIVTSDYLIVSSGDVKKLSETSFTIEGLDFYYLSVNPERLKSWISNGRAEFNLPPGSYKIIAKHNPSGCSFSKNVTIREPEELTATIEVTREACDGLNIVNIKASGSPDKYTYTLIDDEKEEVWVQQSPVFLGVKDGYYHGKIVDKENGCTAYIALTKVNVDIDPLTLNFTKTDVACTTKGTITVAPSGGNQPYQYSINNVDFQSSPDFENLEAGTYTVTVKDAFNCTASAEAEIEIHDENIVEESTYMPPVIAMNARLGNGDPITVQWDETTRSYTFTPKAGISMTRNPQGRFVLTTTNIEDKKWEGTYGTYFLKDDHSTFVGFYNEALNQPCSKGKYKNDCSTLCEEGWLPRELYDNSFRIISRIEWGALPPKTGVDYPDVPTDNLNEYYHSVVIHHTGNASNNITPLELQKKEMDNGYADIPYHFLIDSEGNIYEGRPITKQQAHVRGTHHGLIGIALLSDLSSDNAGLEWWKIPFEILTVDGDLTDPMLYSLFDLSKYLKIKYGINYFGGHKEFHAVLNPNSQGGGDTRTCPGDMGMLAVDFVRRVLNFSAPR